MTTADSVESCLSRLEGASEHWASKADIARLEGKIDALEARLETKIDGLQNRLLLQFVGFAIAIVAATVGLTRLLAVVG